MTDKINEIARQVRKETNTPKPSRRIRVKKPAKHLTLNPHFEGNFEGHMKSPSDMLPGAGEQVESLKKAAVKASPLRQPTVRQMANLMGAQEAPPDDREKKLLEFLEEESPQAVAHAYVHAASNSAHRIIDKVLPVLVERKQKVEKAARRLRNKVFSVIGNFIG